MNLLQQPNYSVEHETEKENTNLNYEQNLKLRNTTPTDELSIQLENSKLDDLAIENQWPQNSLAHNLFKIEINPLKLDLTSNSTEDQSKIIWANASYDFTEGNTEDNAEPIYFTDTKIRGSP
jgi:hypothetical protein